VHFVGNIANKAPNEQYKIKTRPYLAVAYTTEIGVSTKGRRQFEKI